MRTMLATISGAPPRTDGSLMRGILHLWRSTVGKKVAMAATGALLVAYILSHVLANLLVYAGPELINGYGALLHSTGMLLWVARGILLLALVIHVTAAVQLTRLSRAARPVGYTAYEPQASTLAARTMRWGGLALLVFIVIHTVQMTMGVWHPEFRPGDDYANVVTVFRLWWTVPLYLLAVIFLGMHLYHGTWSVLRTLGVSRPSERPLRRPLALAFALFVVLGFASIPLAVKAGVVREQPAAMAGTARHAGPTPAR
jgi:succinate dehydrogenase / fumarate reductase cytochrome b subunit